MPYSPRIKALAQQLDPGCWISYSGATPGVKRVIDARRCAALDKAERLQEEIDKIDMNKIGRLVSRVLAAENIYGPTAGQIEFNKIMDEIERGSTTMPPMKIKMMLHFATVLGPFTPEHVRRSEAYVTYVKELLRDNMIERPSREQREMFPGWAYKATSRGHAYVKALQTIPLPVRTNPEWSMAPSK
jgi:hypothetical protein